MTTDRATTGDEEPARPARTSPVAPGRLGTRVAAAAVVFALGLLVGLGLRAGTVPGPTPAGSPTASADLWAGGVSDRLHGARATVNSWAVCRLDAAPLCVQLDWGEALAGPTEFAVGGAIPDAHGGPAGPVVAPGRLAVAADVGTVARATLEALDAAGRVGGARDVDPVVRQGWAYYDLGAVGPGDYRIVVRFLLGSTSAGDDWRAWAARFVVSGSAPSP